jgi:hypothetical protein
MLPFRSLNKTLEQERMRVRSRRSGPRYRGSNPCLPAKLKPFQHNQLAPMLDLGAIAL